MAWWFFYILALIFIKRNCLADLMEKNADNYGPYNVDWEKFEACKGPKQISPYNCTTKLVKDENGFYTAYSNFTYTEDHHIDEMKLLVYTIKDNKKVSLWNYIINKPCQHFLFATTLVVYVNVENCVLKKGTHYLKFPMTTLMRKFLGNSFFYGEYYFKTLVMSKKANLVCYIFDPRFTKATKN